MVWQTLINAAPLIQAGGSFLGGLTSALGMGKNMSQADAMGMQFNNAWTAYKRSMLSGPSMEMEGLRRAGINPLLRYGSHGSPVGAMSFGGGGAAPYNRFGDLGSAIGDMTSSAVDVMRGLAETEKAGAETVRLGAELDRIAADADRIRADTALKGAQKDAALEQAQLTAAQRFRTYYENALTAAQTDRERATIRQTLANLAKIDAETQLTLWKGATEAAMAEMARLQLPLAENRAEFYSTAWGYYTTKIDEVGGALNPFATNVSPNWKAN